MAIRSPQDGFAPPGRTALHGMLSALPISGALWIAIVVLVEILR